MTDTELDELITAIGLKRPVGGSQRKPIAHGTTKGAKQHRYRKEPLCEACRLADNAYQRARYAARQGDLTTATETPAAGLPTRPAAGTNRSIPTAPRPPRAPLQPCGTQSAYRRHLASRETPCDACRIAHAAADRRLRQTGSSVERPAPPQSSTGPVSLTGDERRAAITVVARAQSQDDARQLLQSLGLLGGAE